MGHPEDVEAPWKGNLSRVLKLIRTNSSSIVDDTSLEKLLTWISSVANDEKQRNYLADSDSGLFKFLSPPFQTIFACPVCANFAVRLAGIIAGCCSDFCDILEKNGTLQSIFNNADLKPDLLAVRKVAVVRHAIFEGLSSMLDSESGYQWIKNRDLINSTLKAFNDTSFYVIQSAIKFLTKLLFTHEQSEKIPTTLDGSICKISCGFANSKLGTKHHYLDLLSQLLDINPGIAVKIIQKLPSLCDILTSMKSAGSTNASLLQMVIEISGKLVRLSSNYDFPWHCLHAKRNESCVENKVSCVDSLMRLTLDLAYVDTKYALSFLLNGSYNEESPSRCFPLYWNELLLRLIINYVLSSVDTEKDNMIEWLTETLDTVKEYPLPEEVLNLLGQLKEIFHEKHKDLKVWKRDFVLVLDSVNFLGKRVFNCCTTDGKNVVEKWAAFLSDVMVIAAKKACNRNSNINPEVVGLLANGNGISSKCGLALKPLVSNGWFADFSEEGQLILVKSLFEILSDFSVDKRTISACLSVLGVLTEMPNPGIGKMVLACGKFAIGIGTNNGSSTHMASVMEALLNDERWEVQDSVMDFLATVMKRENQKFLEFLTVHPFWVKSYELLDADESYIRASSVCMLCFAIANKALRHVFKQKTSLDTLLAKLLNVLQSDDEAFAKRSIMDLILTWLEISAIRSTMLQASLTNQYLNVSTEQSDEISIIKMIFPALKIAALDFDWEVKKKGVECWHTILNILFQDSNVEDNLEVVHGKKLKLDETFEVEHRCEKVDFDSQNSSYFVDQTTGASANCSSNSDRRIHDLAKLNILCDHNGPSILVNAINDCDQMVREAACAALVYARDHTSNHTSRQVKQIVSCHDIEEKFASFKLADFKGFIVFLQSVDFVRLRLSLQLADAQIASYPTSLLNDILAAAMHCDDNLLDCY